MKTTLALTILMLLCSILFAGCVPGGGHYDKELQAGFLAGIWHGWIAPVSLIIGIFDVNVRVYEPNNVGWLYDFGFYIAIIGGFGGFNLTRSKLKSKTQRDG
jgi:hypothetical protein